MTRPRARARSDDDGSRLEIFVGTPARPPVVSIQHHVSMVGTAIELHKRGMNFHLSLPCESALVGHARAVLIAQFWMSGASHLWMIDNDISWPEDCLFRLVDHDQEFVAVDCAHRLQQKPTIWMLNDGVYDPDLMLVEVPRAASCMWLLKRSVIEKMMAAYPHLRCTRDFPVGAPFSEHFFAFFDQTIVDGAWQSEDFSFCHKWRAIGGRP